VDYLEPLEGICPKMIEAALHPRKDRLSREQDGGFPIMYFRSISVAARSLVQYGSTASDVFGSGVSGLLCTGFD
jgi:hypothetical protein